MAMKLECLALLTFLNNTRNKLIRTRKKIISSESIPDSQKDVLIKRIDEKIELILNRANHNGRIICRHCPLFVL